MRIVHCLFTVYKLIREGILVFLSYLHVNILPRVKLYQKSKVWILCWKFGIAILSRYPAFQFVKWERGNNMPSAAFLASTDTKLITRMEINLLGIKVCPQCAALQHTKASSWAADPERHMFVTEIARRLAENRWVGAQALPRAAKCFEYTFLGLLYFGNLGTKWFF